MASERSGESEILNQTCNICSDMTENEWGRKWGKKSDILNQRAMSEKYYKHLFIHLK